MRDSLVFYRSFWEAIKDLPDEQFKKGVQAIVEYGLDEKAPDTLGIEKTIYTLVKPQIDANNKRYQNGTKGGRPKSNSNQVGTKHKPKSNQSGTKPKPNVNDNDNVNVNDNDKGDIVSSKTPEYPYREIVEYLNSKSGKSYKYTSRDTKKHIIARFNEGYAFEDFTKVIDIKVAEWKGTDMDVYLRPSTLFGTKFEGYMNQKKVATKNDRISEVDNW